MDHIYELLLHVGVPANVKGFRYLHDAIDMTITNGMLPKITKTLYPSIADNHGDTPVRVERAMRHAIEAAFGRNGVNISEEFFKNSIDPFKDKPTNGEFIAMMGLVLSERARVKA